MNKKEEKETMLSLIVIGVEDLSDFIIFINRNEVIDDVKFLRTKPKSTLKSYCKSLFQNNNTVEDSYEGTRYVFVYENFVDDTNQLEVKNLIAEKLATKNILRFYIPVQIHPMTNKAPHDQVIHYLKKNLNLKDQNITDILITQV